MKKIILGLVIVLLALTLLGCGAEDSRTTIKKVDTTETVEPEGEVYEVPAEGEEETEEVETEEPEAEVDEPEEEPVDVGVTQEELDQLKADIEGMDVEDLGGLSE